MDPKRDMDDPVNIDMDPEKALKILMGALTDDELDDEDA